MGNLLELFRGKRGDDEEPTAKSDDGLQNPYLNARRTWDVHTGSIINSRRIWQTVAFIALMIALAAVGGLVLAATQSKFIPYVIEVDRFGQVAAAGRADRAAPADKRLVHAAVASFIQDSRTVSFDRYQQNNAIWRVFSMLRSGDPATSKMTSYMKAPETSPTARAETMSVGVEIQTVLQQTPETWEVNWLEKTWDKTGVLVTQAPMRCLITVYILPPSNSTSEEDIRRNPLGVFVRDFNWTKVTVDGN